MPVTAICPQCQATFKLAEALFGKQVRCKKCEKVFTVGKGPASRSPAAPKGEDAIQVSSPQRLPKNSATPGSSASLHRPFAQDEDLVEVSAAGPRPAPPRDDEEPPHGRPLPPEDYADHPHRPRVDDRIPRGRKSGPARDPARKSGSGALIALLIVIFLVVGGGGLLAFLLLRTARADGLNDSPEVAARLEDLRDHRDPLGAAFFFAHFDAPEKEVRRKEVAQTLEAFLKNNASRFDLVDPLVTAYCRWSSSENVPGMAAILDGEGFQRLHQPNLRRQLMLAIAAYKDERGTDALARCVRNFGDRRAALDALESMGDPGKKELTKFYFDNDFFLRNEVQRSLARMGARDREFLDAALGVLADKLHSNRSSAIDFLKDYRGDLARSKEVCEKLGAVIASKTFPISEQAVAALPAWVTKESVPFLVKLVSEADRGANCESLLRILAKHKDEAGVVEAIAKRMESNHFNEPNVAFSLLEELGPASAARAILTQLNSPNHSMRQKARLFLTKVGASQESLIEQSIKDAASPSADTRQAAIDYIAKSPALPKLRDDVAKALNPLIFENDFFRREIVFSALANWWNKDTIATLGKAVNDAGNSGLRHKCIEVMSKMGDPTLAASIAPRLKVSEDRFHAGRALRAIGRAAEPAVAPYLLDTDNAVRGEALRILEEIGSRASLPMLEKAVFTYPADRGFVISVTRVAKAVSIR